MRVFWVLVFLGISTALIAQNQTNAEGRKIGYWVITGQIANQPGYAPEAKVEEGEFADGRKVGTWKSYYPSGKIKNQIAYEAGRPKGPYTTYYENGQIEEQGNWSLTKNYGSFKRFYENGKVAQEFTFDESGKRNGTQKYYHENGQLMIVGDWNGGKESGAVTEYYENGEVKSIRVFNDGAMDESKSTFKEPKTPSQATSIEPEPVRDDANKVKTAVAVSTTEAAPNIGYFNGNGQHTLYNKNKQISQKGEFKNGKLWDGKFYKYDKDGILTNIEIYQNGAYVGEGVIDPALKQ